MNEQTYQQKEMERIVVSHQDGSDIPTWRQKEYDSIGKVMEAFQTIVDYGNVMGRKTEDTAEIIGDVLESSHRTLQQEAMSVLIKVIVNYADARHDGRNEYSVKVCKAIKQALHDEGFLHGENGDTYWAPMI
jgi:hypothetical protein